ncbi:hypothetical protein CARUB_v10009510mg [Capsella rubella]|uniref:Peroxisomal membrane protein n=1 Tax=Capsella rubella TaxID=81985 RepID=R0I6W1_9BRAS|nr:uncharacterized protein LOC17899838 [Capsella rubella]EOA38034.1 hypothetical protein CARUB_v10009510mg [Capsella rubella]
MAAAAASLHTSISPRSFLPLSKHSLLKPHRSSQILLRKIKQRNCVSCALIGDEIDVIPVQSRDRTDHEDGSVVLMSTETERDGNETVVVGFGAAATSEGQLSLEGFPSSSGDEKRRENEEMEKMIDRTINATIVLAAGSYAISKLLTIDHDYWHGWTLFEILRYAPQHNWVAYEEALKQNPVLAKMVISGIVYSVGDWIAQCYEGKPLFEIDRARTLRSGLVGFTLHGSLSHFYYQFCEELFPFQDWWVVPVKVAFDQTVWSAIWNSIYFTVLGFLRLESPISIFKELKATFFPMLTAGWKLWPFAHLVTYGLVPVEQRLLWVDCVELIWVTILSTYSNEKSEARTSESVIETSSSSTTSIEPSKE